jgi:hypothetical protein
MKQKHLLLWKDSQRLFKIDNRGNVLPSAVMPNCPYCNHSAKHHIIVVEMGMTLCKVWRCKCALTFNYSQKTLEEMR